ncbi:MAG: hypothetical protein H0U76_16900 [Ktedonobacteraceae bacterium]|nr:hypothetical protein [Ktedonobacteraceae bacterium]
MKRNFSLLLDFMLPGLVLLDLVLVGAILLRAPLLLRAPYFGTTLFTILFLLLYGGVGVGFPRLVRSARVKDVLWQATWIGPLVGLFFAVSIIIEYFVDLNLTGNLLSTFGFMGLILLTFIGAGVRGMQITGSWLLGVLCSVWSALLGVLIALLCGMTISMFFLQRLEAISADYVPGALSDPATSALFSTLDNASSHLFEGPIYAALLGALGALIFTRFFTRRRRFLSQAK